MQKKTRFGAKVTSRSKLPPGSKSPKSRPAKRGKRGAGVSKVAAPRGKLAKGPSAKRLPQPRIPVAPNDSKPAIQKLRVQLARAQARIDELQASADTDFLLDIPNRRGSERELNRSIAYIKRYHASGALIVLDVDRL